MKPAFISLFLLTASLLLSSCESPQQYCARMERQKAMEQMRPTSSMSSGMAAPYRPAGYQPAPPRRSTGAWGILQAIDEYEKTIPYAPEKVERSYDTVSRCTQCGDEAGYGISLCGRCANHQMRQQRGS